jgi:hypothetical protein
MDATTDRGKLSEGDDDFVRGAREHNVKYASLNVSPQHRRHWSFVYSRPYCALHGYVRQPTNFILFLTHGTCEGARGCRAKSYLPKASVA